MKTFNTIILAITATVLLSCIEEPDFKLQSQPTVNLTSMTFGGILDTAPEFDGTATKTIYKNRMVLWEKTDAISVFFHTEGNTALKQTFNIRELSEDRSVAVFEGMGIEGSASCTAVYPDCESTSYSEDGLRVVIPSEQTGILNGFDPKANVSIAYSQGDDFLFRNIGSLIGFRFATQKEAEQVASVTIRAVAKNETEGQYIGLSGSSAITNQDGDIPAASEGSVNYVRVIAPEGGFRTDGGLQYFAVVYPFDGKGLEVTFTMKNGEDVILRNDTPVSVVRNEGLSLYTLSTDHKLPDEFEVKLDFAKGWPFEEGIVAKADQTNTGGGLGDRYTYVYEYQNEGKTYTTDLDFHIYGNGGNYEFISPNILKTSAKNARILIPAILDRHLKSVKLEVINGAAYPKPFNIVEMGWNVLVSGPGAYSTSPGIVTFPYNYVRTEKNTAYYMQFSTANTSISSITFTYSKTLNGDNSSEVTPEGHFSLMQVTNATNSQMMSYIMKTDAGNVIVIDGGTDGDADKLRGILKEQYGNKVHMWWLTHPHSDHIGALNEILDDRQDLTIDYILHSRFSTSHLKLEPSAGEIATGFYAKLDKETTTKVIGNVDCGARYIVDGIVIDILGVTNEEIKVNAYNNSSMILRFEDKDKSVLFLADAGEECGDKAIKKYRSHLDCDYVQMAHHGQKGVREEFYQTISFKACLWPTPKWLWDAVDGNPNDWKTWLTRQWMSEKGIQEHHVMWDEIDWFLE